MAITLGKEVIVELLELEKRKLHSREATLLNTLKQKCEKFETADAFLACMDDKVWRENFGREFASVASQIYGEIRQTEIERNEKLKEILETDKEIGDYECVEEEEGYFTYTRDDKLYGMELEPNTCGVLVNNTVLKVRGETAKKFKDISEEYRKKLFEIPRPQGWGNIRKSVLERIIRR